jgi:hypothetical protein
VNTGSDPSADLELDTKTTRRDEITDAGMVDMGYHYPVTESVLVDGDFDRDGEIGLTDFAEWTSCMTGPGPAVVAPCCRIFDFEPDADVDLDDFALFSGAFSP